VPAIPHVIRRGAVYYWRRRLPSALAESPRSGTLLFGLRTRDPRRARFLAGQITALADRLFVDAMDQRLDHSQLQTLMSDNGVTCSMSRSGNVWDNAAMESFFSSLKTERVRRQVYRTRDATRADVFDYIERFYNTIRRHSTIGYLSPVEFERQAG
jgi:hypothetical protein